jgi:hypothetical protein
MSRRLQGRRGEQGSRGAGEQGSRGAGEQRSRGAEEQGSRGGKEEAIIPQSFKNFSLVSPLFPLTLDSLIFAS